MILRYHRKCNDFKACDMNEIDSIASHDCIDNYNNCACFQALHEHGYNVFQDCYIHSVGKMKDFITTCDFISHNGICSAETVNKMTNFEQECANYASENGCTEACIQAVTDLESDSDVLTCSQTHGYHFWIGDHIEHVKYNCITNTDSETNEFQIRKTEDNSIEIFQVNGIRWEKLCTNHLSYSTVANVICRELGFKGGYLYTESYDSIDTISASVGIESCFGTESSINDCSWDTPDICHESGLLKVFNYLIFLF